jgi:hypothetical protein
LKSDATLKNHQTIEQVDVQPLLVHHHHHLTHNNDYEGVIDTHTVVVVGGYRMGNQMVMVSGNTVDMVVDNGKVVEKRMTFWGFFYKIRKV